MFTKIYFNFEYFIEQINNIDTQTDLVKNIFIPPAQYSKAFYVK